jgi:hypothetical protein
MVADGTAPLKLMTYERKVAMTGVCRFCGMGFQESRAICPYCICCQYCGLVPSGSRECEFCGNHDLDKPKNPRKRIKRGPQRSQEPRKIKRRSVRRSEPFRIPGRHQRANGGAKS